MCVFAGWVSFYVAQCAGVREQRYSWMAFVLVNGHLVGICGWVGRTHVASATAATEYPGKGTKNDSVQAVAGTFTDEAVKSRVSHTV